MFPSIPIIAETAIYDKDNKDYDLSNLFNDYLVKPINRNSLIEVLNKFLKTV
jgi:CheY-like chemotaxis protein